MEPSSSALGEAVPCFDPECVDEQGNRSLAEPEQDGDYRYQVCPACGGEFGYRKIAITAVSTGDACAVGVPEALRRRASAAMENSLAANRTPVILQIGRRPDAPTD